MKKYLIALLAIGFLSAPALAIDRGAGAAEKSVSKSEPSGGDCRDALYAKFGSKGIDYKEANPADVAKVLKKCGAHCNYGKSGS